MKKIALLILLFTFSSSLMATEIQCPITKEKVLPKNTVVFFYSTMKKNKIYYIPVIKMENEKLVVADKMLIPQELTLFNLQNGKTVNAHFKNVHDNVDYDVCRSIAETNSHTNKFQTEIYATKPVADSFNFKFSENESKQFYCNISNPCKTNEAQYDKNGVALCNADKLIAISHFEGKTQFWHTKQYRHDMGFAIDELLNLNDKLKQVTEDCAVCID